MTSPLRHFGKQNQLRLFPNFTPHTPPIANPSRSPLRLKAIPFQRESSAPPPPAAFPKRLCKTNPASPRNPALLSCRFAQRSKALASLPPRFNRATKQISPRNPDFAGPPLCSTQQLRCARFSPPNRLRKMAKLLRFPTSPDANFVQRRIFAAVSPER